MDFKDYIEARNQYFIKCYCDYLEERKNQKKALLYYYKLYKRLTTVDPVFKEFYFDLYIRFIVKHDVEHMFVRWASAPLQSIIHTPFDFPINDEALRKKWILQVYNLDEEKFNREWRDMVFMRIDPSVVSLIDHPLFGLCIQGTECDVMEQLRKLPYKNYRYLSGRQFLIKKEENPYINTVVQFLPFYLKDDTTIANIPKLKTRITPDMVKKVIMEEVPKK